LTSLRLHPVAWVSWLLAILIGVTTTRNPLYLGLILLWLAAVMVTARLVLGQHFTRPPLSPWRWGSVMILSAALFNALNVHVGTHSLLHLPAWLPLFGGPITLEALLYGALNGLVLLALLLAFGVVNGVLPVWALVGLIPRAYYPVAVVVAIAVTFAPVTVRRLQQIQEAQAIRGHQVRGLRCWLPLLLPLLTGGLEHAFQLAEAMMARGFASQAAVVYTLPTQVMVLLGLVGVLGGLLVQMLTVRTLLSMGLLVGGSAVLIAALWGAGRSQPHTRYRPAPWRGRDWLVLCGALLVIVCFLLPVPGVDRVSLFYYPYPTLTLPAFAIPLGLATWGLLMPVLALLLDGLPKPPAPRPNERPTEMVEARR